MFELVNCKLNKYAQQPCLKWKIENGKLTTPLLGRGHSCACASKLQMCGEGSNVGWGFYPNNTSHDGKWKVESGKWKIVTEVFKTKKAGFPSLRLENDNKRNSPIHYSQKRLDCFTSFAMTGRKATSHTSLRGL